MKSVKDKSSTLIVLLNWNGSDLTLDCCDSLARVNSIEMFDVLIVDNNSSDADFNNLSNGLCSRFISQNEEMYADLLHVNESYLIEKNAVFAMSNGRSLFLAKSSVNHGFAKGCNYGAQCASLCGYENVLFLNNDTVVENNFLTLLLKSLNDGADAVIPQIRFFHDTDLIWNCGGTISKFGSRKYYYAGENASNIVFPSRQFPVSFATGCCLLFRSRYFSQIGMFSEKFFFGEEDVELSLRLAKLDSKIVCNTDSVIYHKVGASIQGDPEKLLRKAYIHYLNRFINMKGYLGLLWFPWVIPSALKILINLRKINKIGIMRSLSIIKILIGESYKLNEVTKEKFEMTLTHGIK